MKRFLSVCLCLVLCAALLCGCPRTPPDTSDPSSGTTPTTTPTATIRFPGFDAETVSLSVPFPADFPTQLYTPEPLTDVAAFEWGQYVPFVQCNGQPYMRTVNYYDAGIITSTCTSLRDACLLYDKLNDLYLTESEIIDVKFEDASYAKPVTQEPYTILGRPMFVDMLFRSHIVSISPDLSRIGKVSFLFRGDKQTPFLNKAELWQDQYDIYQDGVLVQSERKDQKNDYTEYFTYHRYSDYFEARQTASGKAVPFYLEMNGPNADLVAVGDRLAVYRYLPIPFDETYAATRFGVYSVQDMKLLYEITFGDDDWLRSVTVSQVIQDRYLLLKVSQGREDPFTWFDCAYVYDLQTGTMTYLEDHAYYPSLSPDGKYLAYTDPVGEEMGFQNGQTIPMEKGFYIKNLQNDTTVFFADSGNESGWVGSRMITGWVDEQILMQTIDNQR